MYACVCIPPSARLLIYLFTSLHSARLFSFISSLDSVSYQNFVVYLLHLFTLVTQVIQLLFILTDKCLYVGRLLKDNNTKTFKRNLKGGYLIYENSSCDQWNHSTALNRVFISNYYFTCKPRKSNRIIYSVIWELGDGYVGRLVHIT